MSRVRNMKGRRKTSNQWNMSKNPKMASIKNIMKMGKKIRKKVLPYPTKVFTITTLENISYSKVTKTLSPIMKMKGL